MSHEGNDHILDGIRDELEEVDPIKLRQPDPRPT